MASKPLAHSAATSTWPSASRYSRKSWRANCSSSTITTRNLSEGFSALLGMAVSSLSGINCDRPERSLGWSIARRCRRRFPDGCERCASPGLADAVWERQRHSCSPPTPAACLPPAGSSHEWSRLQPWSQFRASPRSPPAVVAAAGGPGIGHKHLPPASPLAGAVRSEYVQYRDTRTPVEFPLPTKCFLSRPAPEFGAENRKAEYTSREPVE